MRRTLLAAALLTANAIVAPGPAAAQARQPLPIPLWGAAGVGQASMSDCHGEYLLFCNFTHGGRSEAVHVSFGTSSGAALVGLEVSGWRHAYGASTVTHLSAGPLVLVYPLARHGLHLKGAFGASSFVLEGQEDDMIFNEARLGGFLTAGIGYDLPLGGGLALAPGVEYRYSTYAGRVFRDRAALLQLSAGLSLNRR
jgi:hypothetical protein